MRFAFLLAVLSSMLASGQTIPYHEVYKFGHQIPFANRWEGTPALDLIPAPNGRSGKVWFRETADGILIFSRINGVPPQYARFPLEMASREHIGLWLAAAARVEMPEIGWGNQFGLTNCKEYQDTGRDEDCRSWAGRQEKYRERLRRLFVRHWQLTPAASYEDYASKAYRELLLYTTDRQRAHFTKLEPRGAPMMDAVDSVGFSYFEVLIRWADFPPVGVLDLSSIFIDVEFCGPGGVCSSTTPKYIQGRPEKYHHLTLARPRVSKVNECGNRLEEFDLLGNRYPGWYFLDSPADVFVLQNELEGYQYAPGGLSPLPVWTHHFSRRIGGAEVVCGPLFGYKSGTTVRKSAGEIDETQLAVHDLPDGSHLLKSGPTLGTLSRFGSGQCGACPTAGVTIYHLNPGQEITVAFRDRLVIDGTLLSDGEIRVSRDWKTVTVYSEDASTGSGVWSYARYCLEGTHYKACGKGPSGPPPEPRQVVLPSKW